MPLNLKLIIQVKNINKNKIALNIQIFKHIIMKKLNFNKILCC